MKGDIAEQAFSDPEHSAIVNAANTWLHGGANITGAIWKKADTTLETDPSGGPKKSIDIIDKELKKKKPDKTVLNKQHKLTVAGRMAIKQNEVTKKIHTGPDGRLQLVTGKAVITPSFDFTTQKPRNKQVAWIIHTPGPHGSDSERINLLTNSYQNCLQVADEHKPNNIHTVALCTISIGIFGYKPKAATPVVIKAVLDYLTNNKNTTKLKEIRFVAYTKAVYDIYKEILEILVSPKTLSFLNNFPPGFDDEKNNIIPILKPPKYELKKIQTAPLTFQLK